jgi:hypothetical protein
MLLETVSGIRTIEQVLPDAFGRRDLADRGGNAGEATVGPETIKGN